MRTNFICRTASEKREYYRRPAPQFSIGGTVVHVLGSRRAVNHVARRDDVLAAIDSAKASGAEAINFLASPMFSTGSSAFIERVAALRLPSIFQFPENAEEGTLTGYGPRFTELGRQRARQLIKVLRGAKPAEIPVEQPTTFEWSLILRPQRR